MSATESARPASKSKTKEKEKEKKSKSGGGGSGSQKTERLKTVVRRLPPNLPEDIFWQSVAKWVTDETVTWRVYYPGKFKTRLNKENIPSRAYIAFKNEEILATFSREYDGHVFRDKAGNESIAIVEFAPFQKVPNEKKKQDSRAGTIEKDEDYISFLESLKEASTKPSDADTLEALVASMQPPPPPTTTPLLEALKAEKSAQKDKEAILRNHAHYKDPATLGSLASGSKKDDGKKKGGAASGSKDKAADGPSGTSKRAAKKEKAAAKAAAQQQQQQTGGKEGKSTPAGKGGKTSEEQGTSKPPKAPRERKGQASNPAASTAAPSQSGGASAQATTTTSAPSADAAGGSGQQQPARRSRPVLGLASRHFEAALSGAGVPVPSGERKSRREREREKDKERPTEAGATTAGPPADGASAQPKPKEEKRGKRERDAPAAPTILQRDAQGGPPPPKILARPPQSQSNGTSNPAPTPQPSAVSEGAETSGGVGLVVAIDNAPYVPRPDRPMLEILLTLTWSCELKPSLSHSTPKFNSLDEVVESPYVR
ncbi:hypothetical protein ACG7TL_001945 [Trametes sanguinea]